MPDSKVAQAWRQRAQKSPDKLYSLQTLQVTSACLHQLHVPNHLLQPLAPISLKRNAQSRHSTPSRSVPQAKSTPPPSSKFLRGSHCNLLSHPLTACTKPRPSALSPILHSSSARSRYAAPSESVPRSESTPPSSSRYLRGGHHLGLW